MSSRVVGRRRYGASSCCVSSACPIIWPGVAMGQLIRLVSTAVIGRAQTRREGSVGLSFTTDSSISRCSDAVGSRPPMAWLCEAPISVTTRTRRRCFKTRNSNRALRKERLIFVNYYITLIQISKNLRVFFSEVHGVENVGIKDGTNIPNKCLTRPLFSLTVIVKYALCLCH